MEKYPKIILDDDKMVTSIIDTRMIQLGITDYKVFNSGKEFIKNFTKDIRIAIIDYFLPDTEAAEIINHIDKTNRYCFIIVISAHSSVEILIKLINLELLRFNFVNKANKNWLSILMTLIERAVGRCKEEDDYIDQLAACKYSKD